MPVELYFPRPGSKRKLGQVFGKISKNIEEIRAIIDTIDQVKFAKNRILRNSVLIDMATIGELLKTVTGNPNDESLANPDEYNLMHSFPDVPWQDLKGFRDIVDHNYFTINPNVLWRSLNRQLTSLQAAIEEIKRLYPDVKEEMDFAIQLIDEQVNASILEAEADAMDISK